MKLTHEQIHSAFNAGSPNRHQCKMLGIKYPLPGGWLKGLIGKEVTPEWFDELSALRRKRKPTEVEKETILDAVFAPLPGTSFHCDRNVEAVKAKMDARAKLGFKKYGVTTERTDLSLLDWLRHAQQESMDQVIYLEAAIRKEEERIDASLFADVKPNPACACAACNPKAWWMVLCSICGNKRCPHADNHIYACSHSNESGQVGMLIEPPAEQLTPEQVAEEAYRQAGRNFA